MNIFQQDPRRVEAAEAIAKAVETKAPDVIVFQEFDINAPAGERMDKLLADCEYIPIYPNKLKREEIVENPSVTIAFVRSGLSYMPLKNPHERNLRASIVMLEGIIIYGVHAPDSMEFLNEIGDYATSHRDENLIILGDFNIATNEWRTEKIKKDVEEKKKTKDYLDDFLARQKWLLRIMPAIGYHDAIKGEPITHFKAGTTIDHVLVSPALQEKATKVTAEVKAEPKLSDHAVIIVDVDL